MMILANELRKHLISEEIVRSPSAEGEEPPCFIEGDTFSDGETFSSGTPSPEDLGVETTVGIRTVSSEPTQPLQGFTEARYLEVEVRGRTAYAAQSLAEQIAWEIDGVGQPLDARIAWTMGDLFVGSSRVIEQPRSARTRYPGQGITFLLTARFAVRRADYLAS